MRTVCWIFCKSIWIIEFILLAETNLLVNGEEVV